jgi:Cys-rich repeat protein
MSYGVTGFPAGDLLRRTADSTPIGGGCIDLVASSSRFAQVTIEGYTPCRSDGECPEGQTCNEPLERCE